MNESWRGKNKKFNCNESKQFSKKRRTIATIDPPLVEEDFSVSNKDVIKIEQLEKDIVMCKNCINQHF